MAMLAEPRRKQKVINLRAKNSAWSKDANKFGQRMLEKMGWSAGKGLGAKENGIVEHVVARYKNDEKGLGFEDRNDQWTKHEDDFNALLANLSNGDPGEKEPQTHSGVSLEVKSKKSKARVHFHKFTRAKDLSRYSEKDLANIFGKKALKPEEKKEELLKDDIKTTEQVFTEKGSMEDYFKNKLQSLNSKNKVSLPITDNKYEDIADCGFQGFSGTTNDNDESENTSPGFGFSFYSSSVSNGHKDETIAQNEEEKNPTTEENLENKKKSKKKRKNKELESSVEVLDTSSTFNVITNSLIGQSDNCTPNDTLEASVTKKKKKSKKRQSVEENIVKEDENQEENYVPKKKKKKKNKKSDE